MSWTHQLVVSGSGALSAAGSVWGTNDLSGLTGWTKVCDLSAAGTDSASGSPEPPIGEHSWSRLRHELTAISGVNAVATFLTAGA